MTEWKIPLFKIYSDQEDIDAVSSILKRGTYWADGPEISEFEKKIAEFMDIKYALAFNSGTSALHALLLAYGVEGREIIVPSFTFISTVNSVLLAKGIPVFAETEPDTFGLDAEDVRTKINEKTKAIIALHYAGFPSRDIEKLRRITNENNLLLIEDNAESMGATINGKKVGTFGDSSILSFCQNKIIPTGEGGAIITDSREIYEKAKLIRSHGRVEEAEDYFNSIGDNDYIQLGYNYRMPTMLAALGLSQLKKIKKLIEMRREKANYMNNYLSQIKEIDLPRRFEGHFPVYQWYPIKLENEEMRNSLQEHLADKGIMSKVYFNPVHLKKIYNYNIGSLPRTEELSKKVLNLPIYPHLSIEEMNYILSSIRDFFARRNSYKLKINNLNMNTQNLNYPLKNSIELKIKNINMNFHKPNYQSYYSSEPIKVLITGGSGLIGFNLAKYLVSKGYLVKVLDMNYNLPIEGIDYFQGSILSKNDVEKAMDGCDYVFHLAAIMGVGFSTKNALKCLDINIIGTKNVFESAVKEGIKKILYASSSEVYGEQNKGNLPINEDAIKQPKSEYGFSKCIGEEYCKAFKTKYNLDYSIVRYFNIYGPNQTLKFVMPLFVHNALSKKPIKVFGSGNQVRAFCYVDDAVIGTEKVLFNKKADNEAFNIGNNKEPISMYELAKKVLFLTGNNAEPIKIPFEESDREESREIHHRIVDITKARNILDYDPKVSLDEGIRKLIECKSRDSIFLTG